MEKIGTSFFSTLNGNLHPTIFGWEEECSVCYPKLSECSKCKDHGLWRSRVGTEHYGLPKTFNESLLENMGYSIYVPPTTDNYVCIIPCFECAKNHNFTWGRKIINENNTIPIDCNGVNPYGEIKNEYSLHELSIHLIKSKYEQYLLDYDNENDNEDVMINIIEKILEDIHSFERFDLENYFKNLQHLWNIYLDIEHIITLTDYERFMSYFEHIESLSDTNSLVSINEIMNDQIINDQIIEEENEEIVNVQGLCRNGIDILDSVMSYDDMDSILNEENYRQLMDIFQKIHNS